MYHLLKFRFKSLLAEEYKSLLSIPPPLLEVTVSRCMYYCLIGDWSWINWIGLHFQGKKLNRVFLSSACTLYKQSQEICIILRTCRSGRLKGNILLATFIHGDCEKLFFPSLKEKPCEATTRLSKSAAPNNSKILLFKYLLVKVTSHLKRPKNSFFLSFTESKNFNLT